MDFLRVLGSGRIISFTESKQTSAPTHTSSISCTLNSRLARTFPSSRAFHGLLFGNPFVHPLLVHLSDSHRGTIRLPSHLPPTDHLFYVALTPRPPTQSPENSTFRTTKPNKTPRIPNSANFGINPEASSETTPQQKTVGQTVRIT